MLKSSKPIESSRFWVGHSILKFYYTFTKTSMKDKTEKIQTWRSWAICKKDKTTISAMNIGSDLWDRDGDLLQCFNNKYFFPLQYTMEINILHSIFFLNFNLASKNFLEFFASLIGTHFQNTWLFRIIGNIKTISKCQIGQVDAIEYQN